MDDSGLSIGQLMHRIYSMKTFLEEVFQKIAAHIFTYKTSLSIPF